MNSSGGGDGDGSSSDMCAKMIARMEKSMRKAIDERRNAKHKVTVARARGEKGNEKEIFSANKLKV